MNIEREVAHTTTYFGLRVDLFLGYGPYPWMFQVIDQDGKAHAFAGIPNECATKKEALKRAWWRAKWFSDGTFHTRYR